MKVKKSKRSVVLVLSMAVLSGAALSVQATERNSSRLNSCSSEIDQYNNTEAYLSVVSKRHVAGGMRVKLAAQLDQDSTVYVNCRISNDEILSGQYAYGGRVGLNNYTAAIMAPAVPGELLIQQ
jgi:hypothetical protein